MRIYVSHGARLSTKGDVNWFVVEPQKDPERLAAELESLRRVGRTVITIDVDPRDGDQYHHEAAALTPAPAPLLGTWAHLRGVVRRWRRG